MKEFKMCPKCKKRLMYCKPTRLSNGNMMPAYYRHLYRFDELLKYNITTCSYTEEVKTK